MATQEDDNKVVCNANINNEQERNFINVYKKFDCILNNKTESFTKKSESLVEVWQNLAQCKFENSDLQYIVQIIDWAKLHTLNIVLTGEWKKFKDEYQEPLLQEVKATQNQLTKINSAFYTRCQKLLDVINNPWSDPTLEYLVRTSNAEIGPKEIEFFCVETAYLTSVRLKKLCESQCEDLALNLVKAFMKCYRLSHTDNFNLNATETQVWFIFDMYVALLYKFKENDSLLEMLKGLSAEEGLNLIKRFAKKRVKISKVWKHCHRIAILASQLYISSTILKPFEEIQIILKELVKAYVSLNATEAFLKDVIESVRSIIRLAEAAPHIYIFCEVFQELYATKMKAFIIELYIRALTTDMNHLERQKSDNNRENIAETTERLAAGFTSLAEVLKADVNVSRECIMTAFSLQPTVERMRKIEELAKLSGFEVLDTGQEWKCKLHPPILPSDDLCWTCNSCGEFMCKPQVNVPLNTNIALNEALTEEKLGITRELCDDLVVLLSCPRYQVFSWLLDWPDLHRLCAMYLNDPERTKNVVTELKFLDIDYSIFASIKKEPLDEFAGIERGYEHYLDLEFNSDDQISNASEDDTGSQESRFYSMSSDSASELHYLPIGPKKSDPNTLKSLRMFRPSLKRSRNNTETNVPEKISKSGSVDFAIPSSSKQIEQSSTPVVQSSQPSTKTIAGKSYLKQFNTSLKPLQGSTSSTSGTSIAHLGSSSEQHSNNSINRIESLKHNNPSFIPLQVFDSKSLGSYFAPVVLPSQLTTNSQMPDTVAKSSFAPVSEASKSSIAGNNSLRQKNSSFKPFQISYSDKLNSSFHTSKSSTNSIIGIKSQKESNSSFAPVSDNNSLDFATKVHSIPSLTNSIVENNSLKKNNSSSTPSQVSESGSLGDPSISSMVYNQQSNSVLINPSTESNTDSSSSLKRTEQSSATAHLSKPSTNTNFDISSSKPSGSSLQVSASKSMSSLFSSNNNLKTYSQKQNSRPLAPVKISESSCSGSSYAPESTSITTSCLKQNKLSRAPDSSGSSSLLARRVLWSQPSTSRNVGLSLLKQRISSVKSSKASENSSHPLLRAPVTSSQPSTSNSVGSGSFAKSNPSSQASMVSDIISSRSLLKTLVSSSQPSTKSSVGINSSTQSNLTFKPFKISGSSTPRSIFSTGVSSSPTSTTISVGISSLTPSNPSLNQLKPCDGSSRSLVTDLVTSSQPLTSSSVGISSSCQSNPPLKHPTVTDSTSSRSLFTSAVSPSRSSTNNSESISSPLQSNPSSESAEASNSSKKICRARPLTEGIVAIASLKDDPLSPTLIPLHISENGNLSPPSCIKSMTTPFKPVVLMMPPSMMHGSTEGLSQATKDIIENMNILYPLPRKGDMKITITPNPKESNEPTRFASYPRSPEKNFSCLCDPDKLIANNSPSSDNSLSPTNPLRKYANELGHKSHFDSTYYKTYPGKTSTVNSEFSTATETASAISDKSSVIDPNSKNGEGATLQQVGRQVAIKDSLTNKPMDSNSIHGYPNNLTKAEIQQKMSASSISERILGVPPEAFNTWLMPPRPRKIVPVPIKRDVAPVIQMPEFLLDATMEVEIESVPLSELQEFVLSVPPIESDGSGDSRSNDIGDTEEIISQKQSEVSETMQVLMLPQIDSMSGEIKDVNGRIFEEDTHTQNHALFNETERQCRPQVNTVSSEIETDESISGKDKPFRDDSRVDGTEAVTNLSQINSDSLSSDEDVRSQYDTENNGTEKAMTWPPSDDSAVTETDDGTTYSMDEHSRDKMDANETKTILNWSEDDSDSNDPKIINETISKEDRHSQHEPKLHGTREDQSWIQIDSDNSDIQIVDENLSDRVSNFRDKLDVDKSREVPSLLIDSDDNNSDIMIVDGTSVAVCHVSDKSKVREEVISLIETDSGDSSDIVFESAPDKVDHSQDTSRYNQNYGIINLIDNDSDRSSDLAIVSDTITDKICDSGDKSDGSEPQQVPNLFEDLQQLELQVEMPTQYSEIEDLHSGVIEVEETKRDTFNMKIYSNKTKLGRKESCSDNRTKCVVMNFSREKEDDSKSLISLEADISGYADTVLNSESDFEMFATTNPLLNNVLHKIDSYQREIGRSNINQCFFENQPGPSKYMEKNKLFIPQEMKYTEKEEEYNKRNRYYLRKEPKYESYPDTGSDSQVDLDSDDQYNRCYIELFRNNLLYDATNGACKNMDYYIKKPNDNLIDSLPRRGKKSRKGCPSKKNRKSKTGNISDKTVLDVNSNSKPKSDIVVRDIRVILHRLPHSLCHSHSLDGQSEMYAEDDSSLTKGEKSTKNKFKSDKVISSSTNSTSGSSYAIQDETEAKSEQVEGTHKSTDKPYSHFERSKKRKDEFSATDDSDDESSHHSRLKKDNDSSFRDYTRTPNQKNEESSRLSASGSPDIEKHKPKEPDIEMKNPRVVLERLSITNSSYVRAVLANVPGLHDTELIRPADTDLVVNVVQLAGGRNNSSVPVANAQTSTQVTPHIQRIGQPRVEKPQNDQIDNSEPIVTSAATSVSNSIKPTTSQPSTLINILSQQVIRPGQSSCVRTRPSPLINIVSHQIIRPSTQLIPKMITSSAQTTEQVNDAPKNETTSEHQTLTTASAVKSVAATVKSVTGSTSAPAPGTILQFICKSATLPKFQQAFGKTVYQASNIETTDAASTGENSNISDTNKKAPTKNATVNIQPIQGSVIYTRQVPVGQTINLIPPGRQVFRIATSNPDQISLVKDTVIHSKVSALLTAALQGKKSSEVDGDGGNDNIERVTLTRPTLVQNARIVKPVIQIPSNVIRTSTNTQSNLSSTTLEQLREFDMVYKQIKERSNTGTTPPESSAQSETETSPQGISVTYLNQGQKFTQLSPVVVVSSYCNLQPAASPALSVTSQGSSSPCVTPAPTPTLPKVSSKTSSKGKSLKNSSTHNTSKASPIPKPQQKPQEDEHTTQRIFDILAEYAEQLRNSPDLNNKPAPRRRSNPPTNPNHNSKRKKNSSSKKPSTAGSAISESDLDDQRTMGSEDSSCGVVQLSVKEEETPQSQTTESDDSTTSTRPLILTDTNSNQNTRNLIIADSSVGEALKLQNTAVLVPGNYIMPVSMVKGGQQIAVVSGGSKILATVPARSGPNMLLFQSFLNQNRKQGVSAVKYSTLQPISGISSQSLAGVSGQSPVIIPQNAHNLTAVTLGQPLTLKKIDDSENRINTELLLAIAQPRDSVSGAENSPQPDSSTSVQNSNSIKLEESAVHINNSSEKVYTYQKSTIVTPIATPVISQTSHVKLDTDGSSTPAQPSIITLNIASENNKDDSSKTTKRVQSVLVTACTSNGPMLSHTPPRYRKPSDSNPINSEVSLKAGYLHNGEKQKDEAKHFQATAVYFPNKNKKVAINPARLDRELHQLCLQRKQAALERELRLQKSLSEECEDLGVDEPSTSDLFPEADLLFDSNHSPSFDQTQDIGKRALHHDTKDKSITLFSDDDNSSSLRTDFLFDSVQYQTEGELQYEQSRQLTNGQSSTSNESGSSCEDNTLLQNCASMSDVTLNSPISPEFTDNPTHMNKYKFKYSNRKKLERHKPAETWGAGGEVSSSEDTMCSELGKIAHSPKTCVIKRRHSSSCDEEEEYKVVRVAISKTDLAKDEESCEDSHNEDDLDSPSGRGARRSVKKMCSCCNGAQEGNRKRSSSRPHTPALHKKAFLNKKR